MQIHSCIGVGLDVFIASVTFMVSSSHDQGTQAPRVNPPPDAIRAAQNKGQMLGFDFYRDSLNAKQPMQTFEEILQADTAQKGQVMATQRQLLERRYTLTPQSQRGA